MEEIQEDQMEEKERKKKDFFVDAGRKSPTLVNPCLSYADDYTGSWPARRDSRETSHGQALKRWKTPWRPFLKRGCIRAKRVGRCKWAMLGPGTRDGPQPAAETAGLQVRATRGSEESLRQGRQASFDDGVVPQG